jgi:hypothetical protein
MLWNIIDYQIIKIENEAYYSKVDNPLIYKKNMP